MKGGINDSWSHVWLQCECGGKPRKKPSTIESNAEEGERRKRKCNGSKRCRYPFKLKGEHILPDMNKVKWRLFVKDGRHNHMVSIYIDWHTQPSKLTDDKIAMTKELTRCHVTRQNIVTLLTIINPRSMNMYIFVMYRINTYLLIL